MLLGWLVFLGWKPVGSSLPLAVALVLTGFLGLCFATRPSAGRWHLSLLGMGTCLIVLAALVLSSMNLVNAGSGQDAVTLAALFASGILGVTSIVLLLLGALVAIFKK
jgi:hypothetical protein